MSQAKKVKKALKDTGALSKGPIAHGVGRRKSSTARIWLRHGSGKITVNTKKLETYFHTDVSKRSVALPLDVTSSLDLFDVEINVSGGGVHSQADASALGIARALIKFNEDYKEALREHKLLTVDARKKERKKPGQPGARKKFQFVKR